MSIVDVQGLIRDYGGLRALDNVSFTMSKGEVVGVLGLNGAGKTTCLRVLAGLLTPTAGSVRVDGRDVLDEAIEVRAVVGFLPEEPPLYRDMTVEAFLRHAGQLKGLSRARVDESIPEVCEKTGLNEASRRRIIGELSHGYRKRVGIAQAILHGPALVILDEPISGLDPAQIVEMRKTIRSLGQDHTVLVSSHILTEISQTCDRILVFHDGRLVAEGTEDDLTGRTGERVEVTVRGSPETLAGVLSSLPAVAEHAAPTREGPFASSIVKLAEAQSPDEERSARELLVAALVEAGLGVRRVAEADGELETVFLGLTGSAAGDHGGQPQTPLEDRPASSQAAAAKRKEAI